ncbi:hypothetical protein [Streptomyces sp. Rer75]|uniref:hypothetical protein n=1 Tax=unclassified Streptomyces TaxID=2593676 RepID=UPI0015D0268C|nr:hypothetical protein [Streptomyces sp. Rer75]QLH23609.1 hypothetical protein HYQ63_25750 [Streptomyces sp. Rer75]
MTPPSAGPGSGYDPEGEQRAVAEAQAEIYEHVQHLHDEGVINLDAPARDVIDVLDQKYPRRTSDTAAQAGGYWLVGDQGWCNHLT